MATNTPTPKQDFLAVGLFSMLLCNDHLRSFNFLCHKLGLSSLKQLICRLLKARHAPLHETESPSSPPARAKGRALERYSLFFFFASNQPCLLFVKVDHQGKFIKSEDSHYTVEPLPNMCCICKRYSTAQAVGRRADRKRHGTYKNTPEQRKQPWRSGMLGKK